MPGVIKTEVWRAHFIGIAELNREHLDFFSMCGAGLATGQRLSAHTETCVSNKCSLSADYKSRAVEINITQLKPFQTASSGFNGMKVGLLGRIADNFI